MKNKKILITSVLALCLLSISSGVFAATKITLMVNGTKSAVDPISKDGVTYVPLRAAAELLGATVKWNNKTQTVEVNSDSPTKSSDVVTLVFPADKYPATAAHITAAIEDGHTAVCTLDRKGADKNREASLNGIPTKAGYDRDEWPMAICEEGGTGASVAYVIQSDNRGAGSWVGNALDKYPDGTKVAFAVMGIDTDNVDIAKGASEVASETDKVVYNSCADVRAAGKAPLLKGQPGYSSKLDRDGDGVACEI